MEWDGFRRAAAEFVGTFTLVLVGAGSIAVSPVADTGLVGVALAHGLAIAVMVSAVGHISGGYFDPAVTFGFLLTRRMAPLLALVSGPPSSSPRPPPPCSSEVLGDERFAREPSVPALGDGIGAGGGLIVEIVLTFFLVWVVFAAAADPRGTFKAIAGLAIGLTVTLDILKGGPLTGAAMNPARAFGPQLVENVWADGWIYYAAPLLGGALAALAYEYLYLRPLAPVPVGPPETGIEEPRPGDTAAS